MLFLSLLLAHLLADFVLQSDALVVWKHKSWKGVFVHAFIHFLTMAALLWRYAGNGLVVAVLAAVAMSHYWLDGFKITHEKRGKDYVKLFFQDQISHVVVLVLASLALWNVVAVPVSFGFVDYFQNPFVVLYLIFAVLLTYCYEIVSFQYKRQHKPHERMKLDFVTMFLRLLVFTLAYGLVIILSSYQIAQTFNGLQ